MLTMNLSTIMLVLLMAYLWQTNSLTYEIGVLKKLVKSMHVLIMAKFTEIANEIMSMRNETLLYLNSLQNTTATTLHLVYNNSRKLDMLNSKLDTYLPLHVE
ncbi:GP16 [Clanis bilineata nucleopolyhedrovirus]|uniref:GP16 n=1 Tax=Clanis bilineata nucleopolyhedrovirus TaxID=1307957 RepID=Q0N3Y9_9ABAC|nr:GP16 [Clanis bilineata nucleopolyhedrovirus]ABF47454.1 GP16 [Clanis bilineata nucleopolyhedrovirus]